MEEHKGKWALLLSVVLSRGHVLLIEICISVIVKVNLKSNLWSQDSIDMCSLSPGLHGISLYEQLQYGEAFI